MIPSVAVSLVLVSACGTAGGENRVIDDGPIVQSSGPPPTFTEPDGQPNDPQVDGLDANNADEANRNGWFEGGRSWWGDFGDPFVLIDGGRYIAYGSSTEGRYVPVVTSSDLRTWYARDRWSTSLPPWDGGPNPLTDPDIPQEIRSSSLRENRGHMWNMNDALVKPAAWGLNEPIDLWVQRTIWAPSVARFGSTWNLYYAIRTSRDSDDPNGDGRFCISVATALSPTGPFRDTSSGPIVCDTDPAGSIDPEVFADPEAGTHYLLWKAAGRVGAYPSALKSIELDSTGRPRPGAQPVTLLRTDESSWEGETIENPSMVRWQGRYLLVYSGNAWRADADGASNYATGWANCPDGPRAPCTRGSDQPLLASNGSEQGPAGGSLFVAPGDRLFLAYAAFTLDEDRDPHPRRLSIVELGLTPSGELQVKRPG